MLLTEEIDGIIVNYNSAKFRHIVRASISSYLELPCRRLFVVDNASRDGSYEFLVQEFSDEHRVKFVRLSRNRGYAGAVNHVYSLNRDSLSRVFFVTNNDLVLLETNGALKILKLFESLPRLGVASGVLLYPSRRVQTAGFLLNDLGLLVNLCHTESLSECVFDGKIRLVTFASGALSFVKREVVECMPEKIPYPSRGFMYLDDIILGAKLWELGFASAVLNEPLAVHYESLSSESFAKAYILGRALAIQRKLLVPCIHAGQISDKLLPTLYAGAVSVRIGKGKKFLRKSFLKGFKRGITEYKTKKEYWKKYKIFVRKIYHAHGLYWMVRRIERFITLQ